VTRPAHHRAWTLIEVIIVLAILTILMGLLLSAIQKVRHQAATSQCLGRLKQLSFAVLNFESARGHLPPGAISGPFPPMNIPDHCNHSGLTLLLPYMEQEPLFKRYHWDRDFDHDDNDSAIQPNLKMFECALLEPGRREEWDHGRSAGVSDYAPIEVNPFLADIGIIDGTGHFQSAMPVNGMVKMDDITDGTSQTLLLVEAGGRPGMAWSSPLIAVGIRQIHGSPHSNRTLVSFCDGSVKAINRSLDLRILGRLATRSGGEVIHEGDW
jgi:prepilin-type N-terminal cleavage/methylation domain-containing protein